jgi:putative oxidoreductase
MAKKISIAIKLVLAALFLFSAWSKLSDPKTYVDALKTYQLFPLSWIPLLVYYVPLVELVLAVLLFIPKYSKVALLACLILFSIFQISLLTLILRGIDGDCGCFGKFGGTPRIAFGKNVGFICALIYLLLKSSPSIELKEKVDFE